MGKENIKEVPIKQSADDESVVSELSSELGEAIRELIYQMKEVGPMGK